MASGRTGEGCRGAFKKWLAREGIGRDELTD
jgi:hypothetical protein